MRRQPEGDAGDVLDDAVVEVGGDPAALGVRRVDDRLVARGRGAGASDSASGTWKSSRTARPPSSGGAIARSSREPSALIDEKRW